MNGILRGNQLKRHIAEVASLLFYNEGIGVVGVDRIAAKANITKRTLYRHFASKDLLIAEALRQDLGLRFPVEGSPTERITGAYVAMADFLLKNDFRGCPFINAVAELSSKHHPAQAIIFEAASRRRSWFVKRAQDAGLENPALIGEQLDILFDGAIASAAKRRDASPIDAAVAAAEILIAHASLRALEKGSKATLAVPRKTRAPIR